MRIAMAVILSTMSQNQSFNVLIVETNTRIELSFSFFICKYGVDRCKRIVALQGERVIKYMYITADHVFRTCHKIHVYNSG